MDKEVHSSNPRVVIIQKLYSQYINKVEKIEFRKHRYKKFIKDIVFGTLERKELINKIIEKNLSKDINIYRTDTLLIIFLHAAIFELLYRPQTSINIIIKEYLNSSNFFLEDSQTKYLNALLDDLGKKLRSKNARI